MTDHPQIDSIMAKIEIKGTVEDLYRISTFLNNNHIKHLIIDDSQEGLFLEEKDGAIDWPPQFNDF